MMAARVSALDSRQAMMVLEMIVCGFARPGIEQDAQPSHTDHRWRAQTLGRGTQSVVVAGCFTEQKQSCFRPGPFRSCRTRMYSTTLTRLFGSQPRLQHRLPSTWNTDFALSRPSVPTSAMDGSPQCGCSNATTLSHFDPAEWAPSTASRPGQAAIE